MTTVRLSAASAAQIKATQRAFRALPREMKNDLRRIQREEYGPIWKSAMSARVSAVSNATTRRVFATGTRVKAGIPMRLVAGAGTRRMSGGGYPTDLDTVFEFGSKRQQQFTRYYRKSPKGKRHTVERRAGRQVPDFEKSGYVVYPALSDAVPRIIGSTVTEITNRIYEATGGGR